MKISYRWLKEFIPGLKTSPKTIAQKLTDVGLEVEGVKEPAEWTKKVVVAKVLKKEKHPNADRLSLCKVTNGKQSFQVVCGASNVGEGKKYPFAPLGTIFPDGTEIKKAAVRGVESSGMLCSEKELGLADSSSGILELEDKAPVGRSFASYFGLNDTVLDVAVTPNRGDCLSHWGIAREVATLYNLPIRLEKLHAIKGDYPSKEYIKISVRDSKGCRRYCSRVIRNVKIAPSPSWMVKRLASLGVRSINNIVDATNYVMLEMGHPLHAFDHRFLKGGKIIVRRAGSDSSFRSLDGEERKLVSNDLVIADAEKPVALAGIIGGANSEIQDDTSIVVLEAACFDPVRIRKTARRLGVQTESSQRFERSVPADTVALAMDRLTSLILSTAGGEVSRERIDLYPGKGKKQKLTLRQGRLQKILGTPISSGEVSRILKSLGLSPKKTGKGWTTIIPLYRHDLEREIDLIEEIIRLVGYDRIKSTLPSTLVRPIEESSESRLEDTVRSFFTSRGFFETIHLSFCERENAEKTGIAQDELLTLSNPLSKEQGVMRSSLLPGLLSAVVRNQKNGLESFKFFELRNVYFLPHVEKKRIAGVYGGKLFDPNWQGLKKDMDLFDGKGLLHDLFKAGKLDGVIFKPDVDHPWFHPGQSMKVIFSGVVLGIFGQLHPSVTESREISIPLYCFDLDYSLLAENWGKDSFKFKSLSPYPCVVRDLALLADESVKNEEIVKIVHESNVPWLKSIALFDLYSGDKLPAGKRSLAYSLVYENSERTLTDEEVNKAHFDLVESLKSRLGVELR